MKKEEILKELSKNSIGQLDGNVLTVKTFNEQKISFSLDEQEDFILLAEIIGFKTLIERIPKAKRTTPSFYTLTFAGLKVRKTKKN